MKALSIVLLLSAFSFQSIATSVQRRTIPLQELKNPKITVVMPGPMTPVQPYAFVDFEYNSCGTIEAFAATKTIGNILELTVVKYEDQSECQAVGDYKPYRVQFSSDFRTDLQVRLKNTIAVEFKNAGEN